MASAAYLLDAPQDRTGRQPPPPPSQAPNQPPALPLWLPSAKPTPPQLPPGRWPSECSLHSAPQPATFIAEPSPAPPANFDDEFELDALLAESGYFNSPPGNALECTRADGRQANCRSMSAAGLEHASPPPELAGPSFAPWTGDCSWRRPVSAMSAPYSSRLAPRTAHASSQSLQLAGAQSYCTSAGYERPATIPRPFALSAESAANNYQSARRTWRAGRHFRFDELTIASCELPADGSRYAATSSHGRADSHMDTAAVPLAALNKLPLSVAEKVSPASARHLNHNRHPRHHSRQASSPPLTSPAGHQMREEASEFVHQQRHAKTRVRVRRTLKVKIRKTKPMLGIAIEGGYNVSGQLLPRIVCVHVSAQPTINSLSLQLATLTA